MDGKQLQEQYTRHLSGFLDWNQLDHAEDWILFPDNIGSHLSIDETCLSQGELYTVVTNKEAKGKKGALVAMVKGTESEKVILQQIPESKRKKVKEITLDLAVKISREPGIVEELAANLLEVMGVYSIGQYTITDTIGQGDVIASDGQYLWTLPIVGRKGFQKTP